MDNPIVYVTILVRDQDEALRFYTEKLGWEKREDDTSVPGARWLTVAPQGQKEAVFTLRPAERAELPRVGHQTGGEFVSTLVTDDCRKAYETLRSRGVKFAQPPREMPFGLLATFEDLYGNLFDLWERRQA